MPPHGEAITIDAAQRPLFAGVDVGGTTIKLGIVDDAGHTFGEAQVPTLEERGPGRRHGKGPAGVGSIAEVDDLGMERHRGSWAGNIRLDGHCEGR